MSDDGSLELFRMMERERRRAEWLSGILQDLIEELYATSFDRYRASGERQGTNRHLEAMLKPARKANERLKEVPDE